MVSTTSTDPIIVAVDGSPSSVQALHKAAEFAATLQAELLIITCWKAPEFYNNVVQPNDELFEEEAKHQQTTAIDKVFANGCPVPATRRLSHGRPATVLIKASENAQLLVMGTRGHGEFVASLATLISTPRLLSSLTELQY